MSPIVLRLVSAIGVLRPSSPALQLGAFLLTFDRSPGEACIKHR